MKRERMILIIFISGIVIQGIGISPLLSKDDYSSITIITTGVIMALIGIIYYVLKIILSTSSQDGESK